MVETTWSPNGAPSRGFPVPAFRPRLAGRACVSDLAACLDAQAGPEVVAAFFNGVAQVISAKAMVERDVSK